MGKQKNRGSHCPILDNCQGMLAKDYVRIGTLLSASSQGTEVHRICTDKIIPNDGIRPWDWNSDVSEEFDLDTLGRLTYWFTQGWDELKPYFPNPITELQLESDRLTGRPDVHDVSGEGWIALCDIKSGYHTITDCEAQMKCYAYLLFEKYPDKNIINVWVMWLQDQTMTDYCWDRQYVYNWYEEFINKIDTWNGELFSGDHCHFCPRRLSCEAYEGMAKLAVSALTKFESAGLPAEPEAMIEYFKQIKLVEKLAKEALLNIREFAEVSPIYGEREMIVVTESERKTVLPKVAYPLLKNILKEDQITNCMTLALDKLQTEFAKSADKGEKGKFKEKLVSDLIEKGAIKFTNSSTMNLRKLKKEIKS